MANLNREIWEGWTPQAFIDELEPQFDLVMSAWNPPLKTRDDVKRWTADNQPYYKKVVPEVVSYFWSRLKRLHGERIRLIGSKYGMAA